MDKRKKLAKQLVAEKGYSLQAAYNEVDRQHGLKAKGTHGVGTLQHPEITNEITRDAKDVHSVDTLSARDAEIEEILRSVDEAT